jgi:hypothetical protein
MSDLDVFGPLVLPSELETRAEAALDEFIEPYLGWVERLTGRDKGSMPKPRRLPARGTVDEWPEDVPPVIGLVSTGLSEPEMLEDGYHAVFPLGAVCIVEANTEENARKLASAYAGAIMACLLQQPLGGPVEKVWLAGIDTDTIPNEKRRSLGGAQVELRVAVSPIVDPRLGPTTVDVDDPRAEYPDPFTATAVEIDVS